MYQIDTLQGCQPNRKHRRNFPTQKTCGRCWLTGCGCCALIGVGPRSTWPWNAVWTAPTSRRWNVGAGTCLCRTSSASLRFWTFRRGCSWSHHASWASYPCGLNGSVASAQIQLARCWRHLCVRPRSRSLTHWRHLSDRGGPAQSSRFGTGLFSQTRKIARRRPRHQAHSPRAGLDCVAGHWRLRVRGDLSAVGLNLAVSNPRAA